MVLLGQLLNFPFERDEIFDAKDHFLELNEFKQTSNPLHCKNIAFFSLKRENRLELPFKTASPVTTAVKDKNWYQF